MDQSVLSNGSIQVRVHREVNVIVTDLLFSVYKACIDGRGPPSPCLQVLVCYCMTINLRRLDNIRY